MSRVRVNYKSDLPPLEVKFKINGSVVDVPTHDFAIRFFVDGAPGMSFECSYKDGEYFHCAKTAADTLTCYIGNHKFGCGRLCCEFVDLSSNAHYADGLFKTVTPSSLDVVLVDGAGDDSVDVLNVIFNFEPNEIIDVSTVESHEDGGINTVTITQANGDVVTFNIRNGSKGSKGDAGVYVTDPDFNIVDDTTTGGSTDALSAEQGKELAKIAGRVDEALFVKESYDSGDLVAGGYYTQGVGDQMADTPSSSWTSFSCIRLAVKKGETYEVTTVGGSTAKAWALTDESRIILSVADAGDGQTQTTTRLTAAKDGYLYVNCITTYSSSFSIEKYQNKIDGQIQNIERRFAPMYDVSEYDSRWLTGGRVWENITLTTVPNDISLNSNFGCMYLEVSSGDTVKVKSKANAWHITTWSVTNKEREILYNAPASDSAVDRTLEIKQDGYVFINCANTYAENFEVVHTYNKALAENAELKEVVESISNETDHLLLMYYGRTNRRHWTPSELRSTLIHTHKTGRKKGLTEWFFPSLLYVEFAYTNPDDNVGYKFAYNQQSGTARARKVDWMWLHDRYFSEATVNGENEGLRALEQSISALKAEFGNPPRRHKVVLTLPDPYYDAAEWGTIDNDTIDTRVDADRIKALKWFIDLLIATFNSKGYQNFDLEGFYWGEENMDTPNGTETILANIGEYVQNKGYRFYWIPSAHAKGRWEWQTNKMNDSYLQTGYTWKPAMSEIEMRELYEDAVRHGMGMEFEVGWQLFPDTSDLSVIDSDTMTRIETLLSVFEEKLYLERKNIAYYFHNDMTILMSQSTNKRVMELMDRLAALISRANRK